MCLIACHYREDELSGWETMILPWADGSHTLYQLVEKNDDCIFFFVSAFEDDDA